MRPGDRVSDGLTSEAVTETILDDEDAVYAITEEEVAAALNAGKAVYADPDILEKFGIVDLGEDVGEPEDFIDP